MFGETIRRLVAVVWPDPVEFKMGFLGSNQLATWRPPPPPPPKGGLSSEVCGNVSIPSLGIAVGVGRFANGES